MPPKIRQLKAALTRAGFYYRPGKGSHAVWEHPMLPDLSITLAGQNGDDARPYQIKDVENALKRLGEKR